MQTVDVNKICDAYFWVTLQQLGQFILDLGVRVFSQYS